MGSLRSRWKDAVWRDDTDLLDIWKRRVATRERK